MWEESVDRAGSSDPADGAARSEAWLHRQRTSVSGRLNGCLNTQRCVNKGQLTPRGQEGANVNSPSVTCFCGNIKLQTSNLQIVLIPLCQSADCTQCFPFAYCCLYFLVRISTARFTSQKTLQWAPQSQLCWQETQMCAGATAGR